jgi:hypothetical protein
MLAWLAPDTPSPVELVPVTPLTVQPDVEEGILGRSKLMQDLDNAAQLIKNISLSASPFWAAIA